MAREYHRAAAFTLSRIQGESNESSQSGQTAWPLCVVCARRHAHVLLLPCEHVAICIACSLQHGIMPKQGQRKGKGQG